MIGLHTLELGLLLIGIKGDKIAQGKLLFLLIILYFNFLYLANRIHIKTKNSIPMQIDGEPVLMQPAEIFIELKSQALMIEVKKEEKKTCS